jgi:predicted ATPase
MEIGAWKWSAVKPLPVLGQKGYRKIVILIHEIILQGLLSFGPDSLPLPLRPLNVLIGPNGSGKSNLVDAIGLLRSCPGKLTAPMRGTGGGVREWIWKGAANEYAKIDAAIHSLSAKRP